MFSHSSECLFVFYYNMTRILEWGRKSALLLHLLWVRVETHWICIFCFMRSPFSFDTMFDHEIIAVKSEVQLVGG